MSDTLADLFAEARTLLGGKHLVHSLRDFVDDAPGSVEPNPAYDALRKVVVEICPCNGLGNFTWPGHSSSCSGYTLRTAYWEQADNGALEGALKKALHEVEGIEPDIDIRQPFRTIRGLEDVHGDTRIPAMQAVVKWLREN